MKKVGLGVIFVITVNFLLNIWVLRLNSKIPFSNNYWGNHHFYTDQRVSGGGFNLFRAWGQTDSQWYLKIASEGYGPPANLDLSLGKMDGLSYAFFPLYPLLIKFVALFTNRNFEIAAFILGNLIIIANWLSINYVVGKIYTKKDAFWPATLIVLFPFSLFLRSYHTEGLYIFELVWWLYFISKKKMDKASIFLAALNVTKGTGWLLNIIFALDLFKKWQKKKANVAKYVIYLIVPIIPVLVWIAYVYQSTGDALYFMKAVSEWKIPELSPILFNIFKVARFFPEVLSGNWIFASQVIVFVAMCWLLFAGRKWLKPEWWWTSFLLLIIPTLTTYSTGHTSGRLALIQIPLWVFLSHYLGKRGSFILAFIFTIFLFWGSLYFVNWYWWG